MIRIRILEGDRATYLGEFDTSLQIAASILANVINRLRPGEFTVTDDLYGRPPWDTVERDPPGILYVEGSQHSRLLGEVLDTESPYFEDLQKLAKETESMTLDQKHHEGIEVDEYGFIKYVTEIDDDFGYGERSVLANVPYSDYHADIKQLFTKNFLKVANRSRLLDI